MKKQLVTIAAAICLTAGAFQETIDLSTVPANQDEIYLEDGDTVRGDLSCNDNPLKRVWIEPDATVTLFNVTIHVVENYCSWAGITCRGNATIIFVGDNQVVGFCEDYPGIYVPPGCTLTLRGEGSLSASSRGAPGIGSSADEN